MMFREEQIAVSVNIKAMYHHQIKVPENERCFLWFICGRTATPAKLLLIMKKQVIYLVAYHRHLVKTML